MSEPLSIPYKFDPRPYQVDLLAALDGGIKRAVAVYHRRAGKDKTLFNLIIKKAFERVGVYYYFFPEFSQGRRVIWDGVDGSGMPFLDHIPKELLVQANKTEMKLVLSNGSIIQIIGTDKIDKVRGSNPVGCVFSEFAFQNPAAWDVVRPILGENGGWAAFNSTPNGKNFFYDMVEMAKKNDDWFCQIVTVDDSRDPQGNRYVSEDVVNAEREAGMSEEMIQQEFYTSFTANAQGYYYLEYLETLEKEGRRASVPHYPDIPVNTFWDIGIGDSTAIWFVQIIGREYHIIDCFEDSGKGLEYYIRMLQSKPYIYDSHYFPHDFGHTEFGTGRSRIETARGLLKSGRLNVLPKLPIEDGIHAVRAILPKCYFDKKKTADGFKALQNYHREYDKKSQEYKNKPVHDWCVAPDTLVRTLSGWRKISSIIPGDYVYGYSTKLDRIIPAEVTESRYTRLDAEVIEIEISNGRSITCTPDHKFLLLDGTYKEAQDLEINDALMPFFENNNRGYKRIDLLDGSFADEHRYVWSFLNKQRVPNGYHIDHLDSNKHNNHPENLCLMTKEDHCSKTFTGIATKDRHKIDETPEGPLLIGKREMWILCRNCNKEYWGGYRTSYCSKACSTDLRRKTRRVTQGNDTYPLLRVRGKKRILDRIDTYDITVPETDNFVAEGVIIHNSSHYSDAFRYFALGVSGPKSAKNKVGERIKKFRNIQGNSWMRA